MRETGITTSGNSNSPPATGLPAVYSPGTATTDSLIAMMTNNVIVLEPALKLADSPSTRPARPTTTEGEKSPKAQRVIARG